MRQFGAEGERQDIPGRKTRKNRRACSTDWQSLVLNGNVDRE